MCKHSFTLRGLLLVCAFGPGLSYGVTYKVTLDTRALAAQTAAAPYSLDFQLIGGNGAARNTVVLSRFDFGEGGRVRGSASVLGGASGDMSGRVVLTDSGFRNELVQGFTPSLREPLVFTVDLTGNSGAPIPDSFSVGILDRSGFGLPTKFFDAFVQIDFTASLKPVTFASDPQAAPPGCPSCAPIILAPPSLRQVDKSCPADVTRDVSVNLGTVRAAEGRDRYTQQVRITNNSKDTLKGDFFLALDGLPRGVELRDAERPSSACAVLAVSPFVQMEADRLRPGQSTEVTLKFSNSSNLPITFTARVLLDPDDERRDDADDRRI